MSKQKNIKDKPEEDVFWYNDSTDEQEFKQHLGFTDSKYVKNNTFSLESIYSSDIGSFSGYN